MARTTPALWRAGYAWRITSTLAWRSVPRHEATKAPQLHSAVPRPRHLALPRRCPFPLHSPKPPWCAQAAGPLHWIGTPHSCWSCRAPRPSQVSAAQRPTCCYLRELHQQSRKSLAVAAPPPPTLLHTTLLWYPLRRSRPWCRPKRAEGHHSRTSLVLTPALSLVFLGASTKRGTLARPHIAAFATLRGTALTGTGPQHVPSAPVARLALAPSLWRAGTTDPPGSRLSQ